MAIVRRGGSPFGVASRSSCMPFARISGAGANGPTSSAASRHSRSSACARRARWKAGCEARLRLFRNPPEVPPAVASPHFGAFLPGAADDNDRCERLDLALEDKRRRGHPPRSVEPSPRADSGRGRPNEAAYSPDWTRESSVRSRDGGSGLQASRIRQQAGRRSERTGASREGRDHALRCPVGSRRAPLERPTCESSSR
jgi:hypothetical protein